MYSFYVNDVPVIKPLENPPRGGFRGVRGVFPRYLNWKDPSDLCKVPLGVFPSGLFFPGASLTDFLTKAEENLELHRDKLDKVRAIRDNLKLHIQSLPDLRQLPDVTGGLAPLPSAGDLYMK